MLYALSWLAVVLLIALWSLIAWATHGAAIWLLSNAGAFAGVTSGAASILVPAWLAPWVPPALSEWIHSTLVGLGPWLQGGLQALPGWAGGVTVASGVVWGFGTLLLVFMGVVLHGLLMMWRRRHGGSGRRWGPRSEPADGRVA